MSNPLRYPVLLFALLAGSAQAQQPQTVPYVDLGRYAGKWHEIARLPNKFQEQCVANVTAEYTVRDDSQIDVINRCTKRDGSIEAAHGRVRVADHVTNAKLGVRFAPDWLSWLPMVWAKYWILDLAPDYSVVAVGDPRRTYLWILSRTPQLPDTAYDEVVNRMTAQGYDTAKLVKTKQE
ncbi:MAG TPA: lipocalin family protein [Burkholderiaceae bacterium]|nr:lipocalin family protein [Burkholderiaceae bacterium]